MKVKVWGARGSISISNANSIRAGGNTTCYEVISECLPPGTKLMIDSGTGFVPAGWHYLSEMGQGLKYVLLYTHYHWDHVLGLTLAPPTFIDQIPMELYGPRDEGYGPKEVVQYIFKRPFFPVDAKRVTYKMKFHTIDDFDVHIMVVHPKGGFAVLNLDQFNMLLSAKKQIPLRRKKYDISECMIIRMAKANHGNATCISYRFEEIPTGKVFVFCSDHEDTVGVSLELRRHFSNADLLVIDAQYDQQKYINQTTGFGHGTPYGVVKQGVVCHVKRIGLTHHDPGSVDTFLENKILPEAVEALKQLRSNEKFRHDYHVDDIILTDQDVFLCYDYAEYEV
ncbi:MAG: MBL fold metallo-hydrolase [Gemmatimonadetes bacterium]|nr:MAG: MBL fold metallo-hydrolase [Gemmatimonadota bacterium]